MYICLCNAITDRQIVQAAQQGARSSDDLAQGLGVGLGCGERRVHVSGGLSLYHARRVAWRSTRVSDTSAGAHAFAPIRGFGG